MSRLRAPLGLTALVLAAAVGVIEGGMAASGVQTAPGLTAEVVVTGVGRPIQLAVDGAGLLVVLSHGRRGDAAGEILRIDPDLLPVDAERLPRVVVPFSEAPRKRAFGSLALDRRTGILYLGEENGNRVYRLSRDSRLTPAAVGLDHLVGGSSIALDTEGRLIALDYASPETQARGESAPPPELEVYRGSDYQGPVVFRAVPGDDTTPARRFDLLAPFFPRGWASPRGEPLTRFVAVAAHPNGDLVLLDSLGQVFRMGASGEPRWMTRLPAGHYHRMSVDVTQDGALLVSTGFHVRRLFRVSPAGVVVTLASELGDPNGVAIDTRGRIYVAETALHRIIRLVPARAVD